MLSVSMWSYLCPQKSITRISLLDFPSLGFKK